MICRLALTIRLRNIQNRGRIVRMMSSSFIKSITDRKDFDDFYKKYRRLYDVGNNKRKAKPITS